MMLLPQKITKSGPQQNQGFYKSYPKMYFLLNLSYCVKSYGHLCQIFNMFVSKQRLFINTCWM